MKNKKLILESLIQAKTILLKNERVFSDHKYLCLIIEYDVINISSSCNKIVLEYFESQKPSENKHKEFFKHSLFLNTNAWWGNNKISFGDKRYAVMIEQCDQQRMLFLNKLIKELQNE